MPQRAPKRNRTKDGGGVKEVHDKVRQAIKIKAIANRLESNALGTLTNPQGQPIEMTAGQLKASELLLKKLFLICLAKKLMQVKVVLLLFLC